MTDELKTRVKSLPPLPESFQKIRQACEGDGGIDEVAKAIEGDPMVVADLLKTANSPLYGFNRQIKNVLQAVSLFGKTMTKSLVINSTIKGLLKIDVRPYGITPEQFVNISNLQSAIAKKWFKKIMPNLVEELFLCALLQDTGKIILADEIIRENAVDKFKGDLGVMSVSEAERDYFGTTSVLLTADIFDHWRFEPNMIDFIRHSDDPSAAPDDRQKVAAALYTLRILCGVRDPLSEKNIELAVNTAKNFGFDTQILSDVISEVKA